MATFRFVLEIQHCLSKYFCTSPSGAKPKPPSCVVYVYLCTMADGLFLWVCLCAILPESQCTHTHVSVFPCKQSHPNLFVVVDTCCVCVSVFSLRETARLPKSNSGNGLTHHDLKAANVYSS